MKRIEKIYRQEGNEAMRQEMYERRREARRVRPQIASTGALVGPGVFLPSPSPFKQLSQSTPRISGARTEAGQALP